MQRKFKKIYLRQWLSKVNQWQFQFTRQKKDLQKNDCDEDLSSADRTMTLNLTRLLSGLSGAAIADSMRVLFLHRLRN